MPAKVIILGGGVAGLSAAQELAERGFEVRVFEARDLFGGKARSIEVPDTATPGRLPLPGEHGFRFFPGFYRHMTDTLQRIPYGSGWVADNLVATSEMFLARSGDDEIILPSELPDDWDEFKRFTEALLYMIPPRETLYFAWRMWVFLTSCHERRETQWDHVPWWEFVDADNKSIPYQKFLGQGATRSLVAMRAEVSSTRTIGTVYFQMLYTLAAPWFDVDRLLNGPTNDVWIDPWVEYLDNLGVELFTEHECVRIEADAGGVTGVIIETDDGAETRMQADYYVAALPVEVLDPLLDDGLLAAAPELARMRNLDTAWMNGVQFYLDRDVQISHGHGLYLDSPWALTSISQRQFWDHDFDKYGDGNVRGILSLCISDWFTPGIIFGKPANECTREEIRREVWAQLEAHLHDDDVAELAGVDVIDWFLDDSIVTPNPGTVANLEPLLINTVGSRANRPEADTSIDNFFLASDYVKTNTDLATMESANEAARRAVNAILERDGRFHLPCDVYDYREPKLNRPWKAIDRVRFALGKPNLFDLEPPI